MAAHPKLIGVAFILSAARLPLRERRLPVYLVAKVALTFRSFQEKSLEREKSNEHKN